MQRSDGFSGWIVSSFLAVVLYSILPNGVSAQSLTLSKTQTLVSIQGLAPTGTSPGEPLHLAVDPAGDVFVADWVHNTVWKVSATGVQTTVGTGLNQPSGVALDANGDVFIADSLNGRILELPKGGGQNTLTSGLNYPYAVTVDAAGDVFFADTNQQSVIELPAGGGPPVSIGSGWQCPLDLAVDAAGNVFVADACLNEVVKVPTTGPSVTIGSGFLNPWGLALDSKGNVFVADSGPDPTKQPPVSGHNRVVEVPANGGPEFTVVSGLNFPAGVALDTHGDLFISDRFNHRVIELSAAVPNFGNVNVCAGPNCSQTQTLTFNINNNLAVGSISVLTGGAAGADFTLASGSTCTGALNASSTATISTCTVNVTFAPKYPGLRAGSVAILDGSGNVLGSTYVQGTGVGPEVTFSPATTTTVVTGLQTPQAIAVDAAGNSYIADKSLGAVKSPAGGGSLKSAGTGIGNAAGIAIDGAGNVFIVDKAHGLVSEVAAVSGTQSTVVSSLSSPSGVAVDGSGNLYIADSGNNRMLEVVAAGGTQVAVGNGFSSPRGVAVDAAGDVFVADTGHNQVIEIPAGGGSQITIDSALNTPSGVAVDAAGDVYIADTGNNRIVEVPAGGGTPVVVATGSSLSGPLSVALDAAGDLFIADSGNSRVLELQTSLAPTLTYVPTAQGMTSSDSPKPVTVSNNGNAVLSFTAISVGTNFAQVPGSGMPADCSASTSLAAGASCNLSISFTPTAAGPLTSAAVLTDNALGLTPVKQSITLQGQGLIVPTLAFAAIGTQTGGTTLMLSASSSSTSPVTFSAASPSACTVSGNVATFSQAGGSCSITAGVAANGTYAAASVTRTFTVLATQTITFNNPGTQTTGTPLALAASATSGLPVTFSSTTTSVCTVSGTVATFLTNGSCTIIASQAGNNIYATAAPLGQTFTVLLSQTITFNPIPGQVVGGTLTVSAIASSGLPVTFAIVQNGNCSLSGSTLTFINPGNCGVVANQAGNGKYAAAPAVGQVIVVSTPTVTLGISNATQTYQVWTNFVIAPICTGTRIPTGTVTLYLNGSALVTLPLGVDGKAYYTANPFNVGANFLYASYSGDSHFPAGLSAPVTITVLPAPVNFQATCFGALVYGSPYQCTVSVSASTTIQPTGVITYSLDGAAPATVALALGSAAFTVPTLPAPGNHTLVINYAAQGNYAAGAPITRTFTTSKGLTLLTILPSCALLNTGSPLTISGTATSATLTVPTGTVTIYDNGAPIGTAAIGGTGAFSYPLASIGRGVHTYYASYAGSGNYTAVNSPPVVVTAH